MLLVQKRIESPLFGIRHWHPTDFQKPIEFHVEGAKTRIYLTGGSGADKPEKLGISMDLLFEIYSENPSDRILRSLKSRGKATIEAAEWIYKLYFTTISRFEALLRVYGGIRNLHDYRDKSLLGFFSNRLSVDRDQIRWSVDGKRFAVFAPRIPAGPKRRNELFKGKQILTPAKWAKLQQHLGKKSLPSEDILAFYRIWARVYPREKRLPVIEASILIEALLKGYALKALERRGFSKSKVKSISDELSFNTCLNLVLPLTLSSSETRKVQDALQKVDRLRRIRNDIVHENLVEDEISEQEVKDGIDAAIKLLSFISRQRITK